MTPNTKCIIVIQETCDKHIPIMKHSLKELKRPSRLVKQAAIRSTAGCPIRNSNFLTFASNWVHPRLLGWFRVAYYFSFLLVFFIYYFCLSSSWGLSAHGCKCQCLWIVHFWWVSLTFGVSSLRHKGTLVFLIRPLGFFLAPNLL